VKHAAVRTHAIQRTIRPVDHGDDATSFAREFL